MKIDFLCSRHYLERGDKEDLARMVDQIKITLEKDIPSEVFHVLNNLMIDIENAIELE